MTYKYKQGHFKPKHPEKYVGNLSKIVYRSSYELEMHNFLDNNPNVLQWSSEEVVIPYLKPTDGKIHRYFPDYWVKFKDKNGNIIEEIIEVKPQSQTKPARSKGGKYDIFEQLTWAVNTAKWQACQQWCNQRGIKFRILTERSVFK